MAFLTTTEAYELLQKYGVEKGKKFQVAFDGVATPMMKEFGVSSGWERQMKSIDGEYIVISDVGVRNRMPYVCKRSFSRIIPLDCLAVYDERGLEDVKEVSFF